MRSLVLFVAIATLGGSFAGCGHGKRDQSKARPELPVANVRVEKIAAVTQTNTEQVTGTLRSKLRASIEAKVSGRIAELPVLLGQQVKAGELIARLDAAEIRARVQQAEASLQQAERDWTRTSTLLKQQAVTRAEYDAAESRLNVAKATLEEAKAMSTYINVVAPFDGVVTRKSAERGDLASPGKPLVSIEDPSALQLEADVPEAISGRVQLGARMLVLVDAGNQTITGTVSEVAPTADPETRTLKVKLDIPSSRGVMPGLFARLFVPAGESPSLQVPRSAVVQRGQLEIVFAAEDQRARMHLVKTGRQFGPSVEILSGLDPDHQVVVEGAAQLVDGQPLVLK